MNECVCVLQSRHIVDIKPDFLLFARIIYYVLEFYDFHPVGAHIAIFSIIHFASALLLPDMYSRFFAIAHAFSPSKKSTKQPSFTCLTHFSSIETSAKPRKMRHFNVDIMKNMREKKTKNGTHNAKKKTNSQNYEKMRVNGLRQYNKS